MGLEQYIRDGAKLQRASIGLVSDDIGSGSVNLGSAYILLNISTTAPCRLRLYDNSQSLEDGGEKNREFGNVSISSSTALIGDISMSSPGNYTIDPVLYGIIENPLQKLTYYRLNQTESGNYPQITFNRYLLEDSNVSTANRVSIPSISASLLPTQIVSGTLSSTVIPRTYFLISASVTGSSMPARVRVYMTSESLANLSEMSRSFATEPTYEARLIVDAVLTGSTTTYFIPKIAGANLQTMGNSLSAIQRNEQAIMGLNEWYYVIQNFNTTGGELPVTASFHVFSLED